MLPLAAWLLLAGPAWAVGGAAVLPPRYRTLGLDPTRVRTVAALCGAAFGPSVIYLFRVYPSLRSRVYVVVPALVLTAELLILFAVLAPDNPCIANPGYLANQLQDALSIGAVYATMAVGLTLIFSVLNIINLAHGQVVMLGGVLSFYLLTSIPQLNAFAAIPVAGVTGFGLGLLLDAILLRPMYRGLVERVDEYSVLITYGCGLFIMYSLPGILGPTPGLRAPGYTERSAFGLEHLASVYVVGPLFIRTDVLIAGALGIVMLIALGAFLVATWTGRSLRAVAQDADAASAVGIDKFTAFGIAFGLGTALAMMAGAALVPVLTFTVPNIALQISITSWVIIVLGGLGSIRGAILGSFIVAAIQASGAACFPDASRGTAYETAFALIVFAFVLLVRPQGLFGRAS
jgi:branched-chain amino acid transport system permease protein